MPHAAVSPRQRSRAKQLRQTMTRTETLLWRYLKADRIDGLGFRRQVPIRNYIADFICMSAKIIVELDGESHDFKERQKADQTRDAFFVAEGFQVLRFTNEQVMSNLEGVVESIRQVAIDRLRGLPLSPALPHRKSGLPDLRKIKHNPGKPGLWGGGSRDTATSVTRTGSNARGSPP